jgi:ubiquinone/menaquinone biosynthesis C-methylase UbiE
MALGRFLFRFILPSRRIKKGLWRRWYRYFDRKMEQRPVCFLNFGLALPDGEKLEVRPEHEEERFSVQLYHRTVSGMDLRGAKVLEISCGRGGGANYMATTLAAGLVIGLDQTESALTFCRRRYDAPHVHFVCGDATALPFADDSFDAVVNVEASHCYPDAALFFAEVRRVLRPGGRFLYADFRSARLFANWQSQLGQAGFRRLEEEDITEGVVSSMAQSHESRATLMAEISPRLVRRTFAQFAGTKGSAMYRAFEKRKALYMRYVFIKEKGKS